MKVAMTTAVMSALLLLNPANSQTLEETLSFIIYEDKQAYRDLTSRRCVGTPAGSKCLATFKITDRTKCEVEIGVSGRSSAQGKVHILSSKEIYRFAGVSTRLIRTRPTRGTGTEVFLEGDDDIHFREGLDYTYNTRGPNEDYLACDIPQRSLEMAFLEPPQMQAIRRRYAEQRSQLPILPQSQLWRLEKLAKDEQQEVTRFKASVTEDQCKEIGSNTGKWAKKASLFVSGENTKRVLDALTHLYREHCPSSTSKF